MQSLIDHLAAHPPAEADEAAHLTSILHLVRTSPAPADRTHFTPGHLTASAVVVSRDKRLLLINHPKLKRWLQPGGHVERGETDLRQTARRELLEETGLDLPLDAFTLLDVDVHDIPASPGKHPRHGHFDLRYLATSPTTDFPPDPQDPCEAQWFDQHALKSMNLDPGIHRMITKLTARGLL